MSQRLANRDPEQPCFIQAAELTGDEPWLDMPDGLRFEDIPVERGLVIAILSVRALPYEEYLQTTHWDGIRRRAFVRYRGQCLCGKDAVDAHHITYKRKGFELPEDVVALCRSCHKTWHETWKLQIKESIR